MHLREREGGGEREIERKTAFGHGLGCLYLNILSCFAALSSSRLHWTKCVQLSGQYGRQLVTSGGHSVGKLII